MKLHQISAITAIAVLLSACGDPAGPLEVDGPSPSVLSVSLASGTDQGPARFGNPDFLIFTVGGSSSVEAVWTPCPDESFAWYALYRSTSPDIRTSPENADTSLVFSDVSVNSWTDLSVEDGTKYFYVIRTVDENGLDAWSNEDSVTTPPQEPPAPSVLEGSYTGDGYFGQITLQWSPCPDDDFQDYTLYRSLEAGIQSDTASAQAVFQTDDISRLQYSDNDVQGLTSYYYALRTRDQYQLVSWSNEYSVSTPDLTPRLTVFFIDPTHGSYSGDAILLKTPDFRYYLIDGGDRSSSWSCGEEKILPLLDSLGVDSLDGIVGSHAHADHIGGLIAVLENMPVLRVWDPGYLHTTQTYQDFLTAVYGNGSLYIEPRRGDILDWGESIEVECLHPADPLGDDVNNTSIVLLVTFGNVSFLFTGDLEDTGGEEDILYALSQGTVETLQANVLKVGHHGSSTSTSQAWLNAVDPEIAAIEVGAGNPYGHPHSEVVNRLQNYGCQILRTDLHGTFILSTDGETVQQVR